MTWKVHAAVVKCDLFLSFKISMYSHRLKTVNLTQVEQIDLILYCIIE